GIRDFHVTGVQTCALPISRDKYLRQLAGEILTEEPAPEGYSNGFMERGKLLEEDARSLFAFMRDVEPEVVGFLRNGRKGASPDRSEERRVGKECRAWRST